MKSSPANLSTRAVVIALGAAALSLVAATASAELPPPQQEVNFSDLDLSKSQDAARLYRRLRTASAEVCDDFANRTSVRARLQYRECVNRALTNAVATVAHPALTALHAAKSEVQLAQGKMDSTPRS